MWRFLNNLCATYSPGSKSVTNNLRVFLVHVYRPPKCSGLRFHQITFCPAYNFQATLKNHCIWFRAPKLVHHWIALYSRSWCRGCNPSRQIWMCKSSFGTCVPVGFGNAGLKCTADLKSARCSFSWKGNIGHPMGFSAPIHYDQSFEDYGTAKHFSSFWCEKQRMEM